MILQELPAVVSVRDISLKSDFPFSKLFHDGQSISGCQLTGDLVCCRHGAQHQRGTPGCWLAGGTNWQCGLSEASAEPQEPGIQCQSGLHLRVGLRSVRPGPDVGETAELHFPVSAGNQETDEEIRPPRPSLRLHLPEFVPQVLLRRQRSVGLTPTYSDLIF